MYHEVNQKNHMKEGVPNDELEFKKLLLYVKSVYGLPEKIKRLPDKRKRRSIPMENIMLLVFLSLLLQYESFHQIFSKRAGMKARWKHCIRGRIPKVDAVRDVLSWSDPEDIRTINEEVVERIYRNQVLRGGTIGGYKVAAIDGVEWVRSTKKRCRKCQKRRNQAGETEYYHRSVVCATVGKDPHLVLGQEMLKPRDGGEKAEGELTGGKRLVERLHQRHGHFADVIVADGLYLNGPFLNTVMESGMDAVIRLKDEKRLIYQDAEGLFGKNEGKREAFMAQGRRIEMWDISGMEMKGVTKKLRVLKAEEYKKGEQRASGRMWLVTTNETMDYETLWRIMHKRWEIEENAFHQLKTYYHADHCYVHDGIEAILELQILAFNMRELYLFRRTNRMQRRGRSRKEATEEWRDQLLTRNVKEVLYSADG